MNFLNLSVLVTAVFAAGEPQIISKSCPPGFVESGKDCIKTDYADAITYCAQGEMSGDTCYVKAEKIFKCPVGFYETGKGCKKEIHYPMSESCPAGYSDSGAQCSKTVPLPMISVCENGTDNGKSCAITETANYLTSQKCPEGFSDEKGSCWKKESYDCTPAAPSKKRVLGHKHGHKHHQSYAPVYSKKATPVYTKKAAPVVTKKAVPVYSKKGRYLGHKHSANRGYYGHAVHYKQPYTKAVAPAPMPVKEYVIQQTCERKSSAEYIVDKYCPAGYTMDGKSCMKTVSFPKVTKCSAPDAGKDCSKTEYAPKQKFCSKGTASGKDCIIEEKAAMIAECPVGYVESDKGCKKVSSILKKCPPGFTMNGKGCSKTESADPIITYQVTCVGKGCNNM